MMRIERQPRDQSFPLSYGQQRLWFLEQLHTDIPPYNCHFALRFHGFLDAKLVTRALSVLAHRHEAFRTIFVFERRQLRQRITSEAALEIPIVNMAGEIDVPGRISTALAHEGLHRFDLLAGPPFRARLLRFSATDHALILNIHHISTDGWSLGIMIDELLALYEALRSGLSPESVLPVLTAQHVDFAVWEQHRLTTERLGQHLRYWARELGGATAALDLPPSRHVPRRTSNAGQAVRFDWPDMARATKPIAVATSSTSYMIFLAVFCVLIHERAKQDDLLIGAVTTCRRPEVERVIGFFVNTVIIRADLTGRPTFRELLLRTRRKAIAAYAHQELPFDQILACVSPDGSSGPAPPLRVAFVGETPIARDLELDGFALEVIPPEAVSTDFDLTMSVGEHDGTLYGQMEYATGLFDEETIRGMLATYRHILQRALENPDVSVEALLAASRQTECPEAT